MSVFGNVVPGMSEDFDYRGNHLWRVDLDIHALAVIAQNGLVGETLSDTIIRGARTRLGLKPH
jgi:hypothetical protein